MRTSGKAKDAAEIARINTTRTDRRMLLSLDEEGNNIHRIDPKNPPIQFPSKG
jgi:hypothetical protein